MAQHRVGDSYLTDEELDEHNRRNWIIIVFVCGALGLGGITYYFLDPDWGKWIRFPLIIIAALAGGFTFAAINQVLAKIVRIAILLGFVFLVGYIIWSII